ncbi:MAG: response regulator, partial [Anaerolineales bacterium]|nr:response regulator [Anaerolineales bacterium]
MQRTLRIGCQFDVADPFWVLVREAVYRDAREHDVSVYPIDILNPYDLSVDGQLGLIEELQAQEIDALVFQGWPDEMILQLLDLNVPCIGLTESDLRHPLCASPVGLYDIAKDLATYLAQQLAGRGRVLVVGGGHHGLGEDGRSRIAGVGDALSAFPEIVWRHVASLWTTDGVEQQLREIDWAPADRFDAIIGLSDTVALAARDAGRALGLIDDQALIVGINGDPLALAAILEGRMTATVQTSATDLGRQALALARRAAEHRPIEPHFGFQPRLVTQQNVSRIAARKLVAMADLPSHLIGDTHRQAAERLAQLETSLEINKQVGSLLDRDQLLDEIANLIRVSYGYDVVRTYLWDPHGENLLPAGATAMATHQAPPPDASGLLSATVRSGQAIFVPDLRHSQRFSEDDAWPDTRSRVIVPIRLGGAILGLLDLHSQQPRQHARQDLIGLQSLADQLGVAMCNAELYSEAVQARSRAEKADQIKTRLLANVSHELRTPLNVILGYASTALATPNPYREELPAALRNDLQQVFSSGEHLLRLINDLLDLSRAEIGELDLFPERIATRAFLEESLKALSSGLPARVGLAWRLDVPTQLPIIEADPVRLRQVLYNLLSNAYKFTKTGEIVLGAEVAPPHLHLWVRDTGAGIPIDLQERIFEPFVTSLNERRRAEGVGLGLTITRRLILLHGGSITLDSQPGRGSTFHLYVPLPTLSGSAARLPAAGKPMVVAVAAVGTAPAEVIELAQRKGWSIGYARSIAELEVLLRQAQPVSIAWDLSQSAGGDWGLVERIRAYPQLAQLPFILFGGEALEAGRSGGVTNLLVKPFDRRTLLESLQAFRPSSTGSPLLIVDDDQQARKLYADVIAGSWPGQRVLEAEDGAQALRLLDELTPGLVLLDLMMPNVDGFEVLEALRARPATQRVPVVVLSGKALTLEDVSRLSHPRVAFQAKAMLSETELAEALRRALGGEEALPQPTSAVVKRAIAHLQQQHASALTRQAI